MNLRTLNRKHVLYGIMAIIALAAIVYAGVFYYQTHKVHESTLYVTRGFFPVAQLEQVDRTTGALTPVTANVPNHPNAPVIGIVGAEDGKKFLNVFENKEKFISNIYVQDASGAYTKITTSDSIKSHLSYDSVSRTLVYQALVVQKPTDLIQIRDWDIYKVALVTGKPVETKIGVGSKPILLTRGERMLLYKGDTLELVTFLAKLTGGMTATSTVLMKGSSFIPQAINQDTTQFAVYNQVTKSIDTFGISPESGLFTYTKSEKIETTPTALAYIGENLVFSTVPRNATSSPQIVTTSGKSVITVPAALNPFQNIISSITTL